MPRMNTVRTPHKRMFWVLTLALMLLTPVAASAAPARIGQPITLRGLQNGERLRVTVLKVLAPLEVGEFDRPSKGKRYVGIELRLKNVGTRRYSDSPGNGATLIYSGGRQADSTFVLEGPCGGSFSSSVKLAPGSSRRGCIAYEIPKGTFPKRFQFTMNSGFADQTGEWTL